MIRICERGKKRLLTLAGDFLSPPLSPLFFRFSSLHTHYGLSLSLSLFLVLSMFACRTRISVSFIRMACKGRTICRSTYS